MTPPPGRKPPGPFLPEGKQASPTVAGGEPQAVDAAVTWRRVARRLDGLLVPVASHMAADLSIIAAALLLVAQG